MRRWAIFWCLIFLTACSARMETDFISADTGVGVTQNVYVVTNRRIDDAGAVTSDRSAVLAFFDMGISVPDGRAEGSLPIAKTTPDPRRHFAFNRQTRLANSAVFTGSLWRKMENLPDREREITLYVHGYNNTFSEAAFRIAQLKTDLDLRGEVVAFSWASKASPLGYEHDKDSVLVAREHLVDVMKQLHGNGAKRIVLVGHSMGALLVMEALRTADLKDPGFSKRALSGVVLVSPDLDVDVFRSQAQDLAALPEPFIIFTSKKDKALNFSAKLAGRSSRLGNLSNVDGLQGLPVQVVDVTAFAKDRGPNHFTAGSSPALLALLRRGGSFDREFLTGRSGPGGLLPGTSNTVNYPAIYVLGPQR